MSRTLAPEPRRLRASRSAIQAALAAMKASGVPVDKVCVIGGHVEIHCGRVDGGTAPEKDEGLEKW
ncbi:hypothetical protein [Mesorhizobium sp. Root172]|uniref:hypothetical protein n=1 Tax=Mesorhizobium sp. Root172 TaxID=1736481 RepID=UPI000A9E9A96|nr:hypothetical protein [Mesorhizobium sp. Root172]